MSIGEEDTLLGAFNTCFWKQYIGIVKSSLLGGPILQQPIETPTLIHSFKKLSDAAERLDLSLSSNEDLDELSTGSLQIMLIPFVIGDLMYSHGAYVQEEREATLRIVKEYMNSFLESAKCVYDPRREENPKQDPREIKITRHRRQQGLIHSVKMAYTAVISGRPIDDCREAVLGTIEYFVLQCMSDLRFVEDELLILSESPGDHLPDPDPPKKPWSMKITDKSQIRTVFNNSVFRPDITMPTMSLEEFAQAEMADLKLRQRTKAEAPVDPALYYQALRMEAEAKVLKDRAWDDWKDDNPRGSGNKMSNLG
jgi:hypothetical protein